MNKVKQSSPETSGKAFECAAHAINQNVNPEIAKANRGKPLTQDQMGEHIKRIRELGA